MNFEFPTYNIDMSNSDKAKLDASVQYIKGIGPRRSEILAAHGIRTIADLIEYLPLRIDAADANSFRDSERRVHDC